MPKIFVKVPREVLKHQTLSPYEKLVIMLIIDYQGFGRVKRAFPSQKTIASDLNLSVETVKRTIKSLKTKGILLVGKTRIKNRSNYIFSNRI